MRAPKSAAQLLRGRYEGAIQGRSRLRASRQRILSSQVEKSPYVPVDQQLAPRASKPQTPLMPLGPGI